MSNYIVIFIDKQLAMPDLNNIADTVSEFHTFYESVAATLNAHRSTHSLSGAEIRILSEISVNQHPNAGQLATATNTDPGYLTRIIRSLEKQGLASRAPSRTDARSFALHPTEQGKHILVDLQMASRDNVLQLLQPLNVRQQEQLATAMTAIRQLLKGDSDGTPEVSFRHQLLPGDIGYLIHLHGELYAREAGYNLEFEAHVCKTFAEFLSTYSPAKDRIILAVANGKIIGSIAVVGATRQLAQLRWFVVHPDYRGLSIGKRLLEEALAFSKEKYYQTVYLMTTSIQEQAGALFKQSGFRKTGEKLMQMWGQQLYEQRYDKDLV
ncbi:bifunctional helix-turn-helix transcriptional regulator/GNAT family N-acetyltransferase [Chitinophaga sp. sic0106]|uniref:bifunctional helix-turn-helix transcriptional regulator/GNAT family N-acetyltransferase n=1 Tax=Chitinophaga sp. sic0106 TaxID=2854785 RepID=UPI001C45998D|nr:bifunctional helix-turn-helix transcriptional regulator/GNAT family N-acetyltransferase [Chitinophaga sp. sic0106]MBV7532053.1 bifunctional helix-turn-helix transcriptional regulator/GNAT family N-acetyltransferase [Chitinophaga sp. sic0106]